MTHNSSKANEPRKAAQTIALDAWGRGSDRKATGRLLSKTNYYKNKKTNKTKKTNKKINQHDLNNIYKTTETSETNIIL